MAWPFEPPVSPMEARVAANLPEPPGWVYEPKWDGFRCLAWRDGDHIRLDSRNQRPLLRYFPEPEEAVRAIPDGSVVDGEVVVVRDGQTDFDALQQRIHPAESRIRLLAAETPAELVAFDMLAAGGRDLRAEGFVQRREALAAAGLPAPWHLTPSTDDIHEARRWFTEFESAGCDGIVAKQQADPYREGKRAMVKVKHRRTVDTVVGGYRLHKEGDRVGSLLLGLYDPRGQLHFIGHCSGFSDADRKEILARLRPLETDTGFGEGVRRPGAESRWSAGAMPFLAPLQQAAEAAEPSAT